ncbi:MAG: hypothetical protein RL266_1226, partial [Bacteroidota bacterium]
YVRTKKILSDNKDKLEKLAEELLVKEVIFKENLEEIFGKRQWQEREELASVPAASNSSTESADKVTEVSEADVATNEIPNSGDPLPQS